MPAYSFRKYRRLLEDPPATDPFALRVTTSGEENARGEFILYWMQSARRLHSNLALEYAISLGNSRKLPVVVYESIRPDYPSANDRIHTFVLDGVTANRRDAKTRGLRYIFFLPRTRGDARGVVRRLAARASLVVTDEFPTFILREQTERFRAGAPVAVHLVDGNGILPMRIFEKEQYSARFLRDRAHRLFPEHWTTLREIEPSKRFSGALDIDDCDSDDTAAAVRECAIDHSVPPVAAKGGRDTALARLSDFVREGLHGYADLRNKTLAHTSGLSPYLHFGHISAGEIAREVLQSGAPSEDVDSFLEEAIIRRELSFNLCFYRADHDSLMALPDWAKRTLDEHRRDRRNPQFNHEEMERAETGDEVWNLAQRQLLACGTIHGYLRMLWGKKIIEWSATPEAAHATMVLLHDRYAIDGRDPNTHSGILWCFGKHDRPWAPERPIFGIIRYMSSESSARKVRLKEIEEALVTCGVRSRLSKKLL
ncbi:MAG: deoxyribodipyrimidine photo-lyase [Thermoanaerobaculia bacterium]